MATADQHGTWDPSYPDEFAHVRSDIAELLDAEGIVLAILHGSRARGDAHARSDLDVAVLSADRRSMEYRQLGRVADGLSRILGADVDLGDLSTGDAIFRYEVVRCGKVLFEARDGIHRDYVADTLVRYADIERFIPELVAGVARRASRDVQARETVNPPRPTAARR